MSVLRKCVNNFILRYGNCLSRNLPKYDVYVFSRHRVYMVQKIDQFRNHLYGNYTIGNYSQHQSHIGNALILCGLLNVLGLKRNDEPEPESELIITMKRGILLMQRGEFKKSEQMLHVALKLAQDQQNKQAVTYIYDLMANLAYEVGEFDKAENLFVNVLQHLMSSGIPQDDNKIIHISLKLANIYKEKKDNRKAEEGFKFCTDKLQKKVNEDTSDEDTLLLWAMSLDWYARFVLEQGRYKEAFDNFKNAYDMSVRINGAVNEQNVVLLNDLGTVCCLQEDYDGAIKYLTQAVSLGKSLPDMEDFASIYVNLGTVYLKKMMYEEAKRACEAAWKTAKLHNNKECLGEANVCLDEIKVKWPAEQLKR